MKELQCINSTEIEIKEYGGQRVVTFRDIDAVHGRPGGTARKRFNDNRDRFVAGEDYFKICASEFRTAIGDMDSRQQNDVTLITESGYLMLVKSFTDDLAWKVQRELVDVYFRAKSAFAPDALNQMISSPEFGIRLLTELKAEQDRRRELENKIAADVPAVRFANALTECETNILVRDLAKLLKQNGVDTGEKRLYEQLRSDGYLIKEGSDKNMPTQRAMDLGLFFIKESPRISKDGAVIDRVSRVTPKGQKYFLNRYAAARRRDLPSRASGAEN